MAEQDLQQPQASFDEPAGAGVRLRRAREALRLSRADVAARTKIAERHLAAIEEERFSDLASSTYAVGFSRAYARAVGLDEREIAQAVRGELDMVDLDEAPPKPTFEPGDPARVPSSRAAWLAGAGALAVLAIVGVFWGSYIFPAATLPDLTSDAPPSSPPVVSAPPAASAVTAGSEGPVVVTAVQPGVWIKVTDEAGQQLFQKELAQGESYTVPADAAGPQLRTARPEALRLTVGGRPVPALAQNSSTMTVPLSGAALLARGAPPAQTQARQVQAAQGQQTPVRPAQTPTAAAQTAQAPVGRASPASATSTARAPQTARSSPATARPTAAAAVPGATPSSTRAAASAAATNAPRAAPKDAAPSPSPAAPTPSPPAASAEAGIAAPVASRPAPAAAPEASPVSP
jgi:cytoskeleton protein RodZ